MFTQLFQYLFDLLSAATNILVQVAANDRCNMQRNSEMQLNKALKALLA